MSNDWKKRSSPAKSDAGPVEPPTADFVARLTPLQGQYLAYIHAYLTLHGQPPAESDLVKWFRRSAPTIHNMIKRLESLGLIVRKPGVARSIKIAIPVDQIPKLEN